MNKSAKKTIRILSGILALSLVIFGSLAYFSDTAETTHSGTTGTVSIDLETYYTNTISRMPDPNWDLMNPGDAFPFQYILQNLGNKSIDVRTTITITSSVPMVTDENGQAQFELYADGDVYWTADEGAKPYNGATPLEVRSISADGKTITYNIPDYILNGTTDESLLGLPVLPGEREIEPDALQFGDIAGVYPGTRNDTGVQAAYYYLVLVFRGDSDNSFQNASLRIDTTIEAKQHRNTASGWTLVAEEGEIVAKNDNPNVVPSDDISAEVTSTYIAYCDDLGERFDFYGARECIVTDGRAFVIEEDDPTGFTEAEITYFYREDSKNCYIGFKTENHTYYVYSHWNNIVEVTFDGVLYELPPE